MKKLIEFVELNSELVQQEINSAEAKVAKYKGRIDEKRMSVLLGNLDNLKALLSCEFGQANEELVNKILNSHAFNVKSNSQHLTVRDLADALSGRSMPQYDYFAK